MTVSTNINTVFESLRETFQKQDSVRDKLREKREEADAIIRAAQHELITFHTTTDPKATAQKIKQTLLKTGPSIKAIESMLPDANAFYRYADIWAPLRQMMSMIVVVLDFVDTNGLASIERVKELCGGLDFKLPLEDYLFGVCNAISEFVRLSMNRVIMMDYDTPKKCTVFAIHVFEAFRELNFKNDFLRKRYDGIKYDIKKLEEIVYDLSIRGLIKAGAPCTEQNDKPAAKDAPEKTPPATVGDEPTKKEAKLDEPASTTAPEAAKEEDKKSAMDTAE